ncbi:hypothetical protein ACI3PL_28050, partial [Lacticaseibacillus paracasei]
MTLEATELHLKRFLKLTTDDPDFCAIRNMKDLNSLAKTLETIVNLSATIRRDLEDRDQKSGGNEGAKGAQM